MKKLKITFTLILLSAVLFSACNNLFNPMGNSGLVTDGYGQATVNIESVSARTVYPATTFDDVEYTFTQNGSPKLPTSVVGSTFTLETGTNWVVTVKGYKTVSSVKTLIAQGSSTAFTITNGGSTPVSVKLSIVDAVKTQDGTLTINITKPGDATITSLLLENMFDVTNPVITDENGNKTVPAGIYLLTVRLERTDGEKKFAGTSEIVYIYPYMTTSFTKTFNASDFSVSEAMTTKTAMQYFADEGITIGINVGNSLDAVDKSDPSNPIAIETAWGNVPVNQAYLNGLRNLGFKIVRIPVTWLGHTGPAPDYTIEETYLARVAEVVDMARNAGLKAFINIHHDGHHDQGGWLLIDHATANPTEAAEMADRFEKMWIQIADYFKNYGDWLMFQGFNEIQRGDWSVDGTPEEYAIINNWNQLFTDAVRGTGGNNASRFLLYYGYMTSKKIATDNFVLPTDTATGKQIVCFHYYEPVDFSLLTTSITYTGIESSLASDFAALKTKFVNNGVPVIIGESGPARYENWSGNTGYSPENAATHRANRLTFIDLLFGTARANGIVPVYWENGIFPDFEYRSEGDFSLIDRVTGQPNSPESAEVIQRMVDAVNNSPPPPPTPPAIGGNLDNYVFGTGEHGETVYTQAVWSLTGTNLTTAQAAGTKLVLRLSQAPNAALQLVWQGPANELWWKQTDILGPTGDILNAGNATWNSVTNTLTINLSAAADYSTFTAQPDLNLIIAYYGGDSVNDLGIISVNLVSGDVPTPPTTITGNLGNYRFGTDDGVNYTNYNQAVWELTSPQVTTAQTAGTKLVLQLSQAPADSLDFVWQGPTNAAGDPSLWWKQTDILGPTGDILNASYATWNSGTSTLIINLSAAADYSTFTSQPDLNLIIVYHGGDSVNDLGIVSASLTGGEAANPAPSYPPSTPSITTVATPLYSKWPFHVGAAVPGWGVYPYSVDGNAIDSNSQQFPLLDHFKVYVAENDMKPESIMPSQWQSWYNSNNPLPYDAAHPYRWTNSDALLHIAEKNGKDVRGHVLIWHAQTPEVFFRTGDKDSALVSKEVLYQRMEQHIKTVFERYGGRIKWWDVVNESVGDSGGPRPGGDPASGGSRYTEIMESSGATGNDRYEYILKSFQWARQYADANGGHDVKLYLTDYNIEYSGAKQTEFLNLLDYLITNNAPIDGVGMQSHISIHWPTVTEFSNAIDQFTARVRGGKNLTVQICELDISVFAYNDTRAELPPEELTPALSTLAQLYRDLFDTFYDKYLANKLEMVLVWGLSDAHSWLNDRLNKTRVDHCLLFDRSYQPKEAFNRLITGPVAPPPPVAFTDSKTMVDSAPVFTAPASGDPGTINGDGTITLVGTQVVDYLFPGIPVADANNTNNIATISEFDYFVIQYSGVTYTGAGNQTEVRWRQIGTGAGGTEFAPHGGNQYPQLNDGNTIPNGNTRFDVSSITNAGIAISGTANTNFTFKVDSVTFYVAEKITINFVADDVSIGYTYGGTTLSPIVDAKVLHPIGALPTISASDYPAGYTFGGWQFGTTPVTATTRVAANTWTMLTAKWNPVRSPETYYLNLGISNVVTSNSTGGSLVNSATNDTDGYLVLNYTANDQRALIGLNGRLNNPDSGEYITIGSALQAAASITLSITATTNDGGANYRVIIGRNAGSDWAWSETSVDNKNLAGGIIGQAFTTKNNQPSPPGSEIWDPTVLILQSRAAVTHTYTISEIKFELTF